MEKRFVSKLVALVFPLLTGCAAFDAMSPGTKGAVPSTPETPAVVVTSPSEASLVSDSSMAVNGSCKTASGDVTISGSAISSDVNAPCASDAFAANVTLVPTEGTKTLVVSQSTPAGTTTATVSVTRNCAENYVLVPANATLGTPAFCMSKFEMKVKTNAGAAVFDGYNGGVALDVTQYKPDSRPDGIPWVRITQANAILECASLGTGYHLITAREWNAMARNAEGVASNWENNAVGSGRLFTGHSDGTVSTTAIADGYAVSGTALLSAGTGLDPYVGTGNAATDNFAAGKEQRRTFTLSNGAIIWDAAGNARDFNDVDGLGSTIAYTGAGSSSYNDPLSAAVSSFISSIVISGGGTFNANWLLPATAAIDQTTNLTGRYYVSSNARTGRIITRGANFGASNFPGLFGGDFDTDNATTSGSASFRCAKNF